MLVQDTEVRLGLNPNGVLGDHSHLEVSGIGVSLEVLGESATVGATNENNIKISALGVNCGLLNSATSESTLA